MLNPFGDMSRTVSKIFSDVCARFEIRGKCRSDTGVQSGIGTARVDTNPFRMIALIVI
jgi:hypothetical protein